MAAGTDTAIFVVKSWPVSANITAILTARTGEISKSADMTIDAPVLESFAVDPSSVEGSSTTTVIGTIVLTGPPPSGGALGTLTSSSPSLVTVSSSVSVHSGSTSVIFNIAHVAVSGLTPITLTALLGSVTKKVVLIVSK